MALTILTIIIIAIITLISGSREENYYSLSSTPEYREWRQNRRRRLQFPPFSPSPTTPPPVLPPTPPPNTLTINSTNEYFLVDFENDISYDSANDYCNNNIPNGVGLATIDRNTLSYAQQLQRIQKMSDLCDQATSTSCWIGLRFDNDTMRFYWDNGQELDFNTDATNFDNIIPDPNMLTPQYCVFTNYQNDYKWDITNCDYSTLNLKAALCTNPMYTATPSPTANTASPTVNTPSPTAHICDLPTTILYYEFYDGMNCGGTEQPDLLRDYVAESEECKDKCIELGNDCKTFIRVNSGSTQHSGKCFFRNGDVVGPTPGTGDDRDCYIKKCETDPFIKHTGKQCTGSQTDIVRNYIGSAQECKQKCMEIGTQCIGFIRVNSGNNNYNGQCFFRAGTLNAPYTYTGDNRDCFERT